jgi:flagellar hook-associated protein 1 FlgK
MGNGIFGIGISGLAAAQAGLVTTGHNIANANTEGYHRQRIESSTAIPLRTGSGFFGQGVQVDTVMRVYSQFLDTQVAQSQAQASYHSTLNAQLTQVDNLLADTNAGLSPALQDFFTALHDVAASPASVPSRQSLLSSGSALAARFNSLNARLDEIRSGVNSQISATVTEVNSYAQQIASLNQRILIARQNPMQLPNDLLDQRGALVEKLNALVGTNVVGQSDGTINVFIGNGQNLVIGQQVMKLTTVQALDDPQRLEIGFVVGSTTGRLDSSLLQSGSLGGLLEFRAKALDPAQNALGRVAIGIAQSFNDQHRLGQGLDGSLGGDFFSVPAPGVTAKTNNTGTLAVSATIDNIAGLTTSDYRLAWTGANYTLTRLSDNTVTTYATLPQTVDGITISGAGAPAVGDSFLIQPTRNAARSFALAISEPLAVAAAAPIRTGAAGGNTGTGTISAGTVNPPAPPDVNLQQPVTITFTSPTTFDVTGTGTGNPVGVAYTPGANITYNGWTLQISGSPAAGDVFTVAANSGGVSDGRNALLLADLQTRSTLAGGTTSYQGAYSQIVSAVGNQTRESEVSAKAQDSLVSEARQAQQALSGVNLDEEAANLLRYQQAYQASGKMLQIASSLFQDILDLGN